MAHSTNDSVGNNHLKRWDLKSEVKGSDVILVGRIIPITLYGAMINDCYLIVADEVISGELQSVSILELPTGLIEHRVQVYEEMVKNHKPDDADMLPEEHLFQLKCSEFRHLFFLRKADRTHLERSFPSLSVYHPVAGYNGIVALDLLSVEQHSRQQIDMQYNMTLIDSSQEFIQAVKFYLSEKLNAEEELVDEERVPEPVQAIYRKISEPESEVIKAPKKTR